MEIIDGSDAVVRSTKVPTNDESYKGPAVKLPLLLPNESGVFLDMKRGRPF